MSDITLREAERKMRRYTLRYGPKWSNTAKQNTPIPRSDLATVGVYFYVKSNASDAEAWLRYSDADSDEIEWEDETNGIILVKLGTISQGQVGNNVYECRLNFSDDSWMTIEDGQFIVLESVVDTPSPSASVSPSSSVSPSA